MRTSRMLSAGKPRTLSAGDLRVGGADVAWKQYKPEASLPKVVIAQGKMLVKRGESHLSAAYHPGDRAGRCVGHISQERNLKTLRCEPLVPLFDLVWSRLPEKCNIY